MTELRELHGKKFYDWALDAWTVDKDHIGDNISLKLMKYEKNTKYETMLNPVGEASYAGCPL